MNEEVEITLLQDDVTVETPLVADYILPTATANTLGGVKIGNNINIDSGGHISVPIATDSGVGLVKPGTGLAVSSDGTLTATGTYELPEATKTTLGGVYVDDELSTTSTHPVQNAVVALELSELDRDITSVSGTVSGLNTTVGDLSTTVDNLSTTVGNLSTAVDNNTNAIGTCNGNISTINDSISDINEDITSLGNGLSQLQDNVDDVLASYTEATTGVQIDDTVWTDGSVRIYQRGRTGIIYISLEGDLTMSGNTNYTLYTIQDSDAYPTIDALGIVNTDDGLLDVVVNTSGEIVLYNNTNNQVHLTTIKGNIPVVWN